MAEGQKGLFFPRFTREVAWFGSVQTGFMGVSSA
jgi:hypothetical protein